MFAPYQIDYTVKNASKTFGFSKKRISFKFGVANMEAVEQGLTGAHCRGSEHEVIFIWTLNSGKRQILADGKDVHYSESGQNGWTMDQVFQHQFQLRIPNFSAPVVCHLITQPANKDVPSIHPFDLRVNGISFFSFSKIFQLGTPQMVSRPLKGAAMRNADPDEDPYMTPDERRAIAAAKLASIRDLRERETRSTQSAPTVMNRDEGNLINLLDDSGPPGPPPMPQPAPGQFVSSMTMDTSFGAMPAAPTSAPSPYGQQAYSNYALGAPPPQQQQFQQGYGQLPPQHGYGQQQQQQQYPNQFVQTQNYDYNAYHQPPTPQGYGQQPQYGFTSPPGTNMMSPTGQSVASYGSAPSFAQPPRQQQQPQYQGYPQY